MPASKEPSRGRRRTALAAVLAGVLVVGLVAVWVLVTRSSGDDPQPPAAAPSTAAVDLAALGVERTAFCDRLEDTDVPDALDAPVTASGEYRSGERVRLAAGVTDVSHEFGCTFAAASGARARVWVFAEPVSGSEAARIGRGVRREAGCRALESRPAFGRSPAGTVCRVATPPRQRATLRGRFGDAWVSCQLTGSSSEPRAEVVRRAEQWCVRVVTSLGTS